MRMYQRRLFVAVFPVIALCCLFTACEPIHKSLGTLKVDATSDPRYESIVFGKVHFVSKEGLLGYVIDDYMQVYISKQVGEKIEGGPLKMDPPWGPWNPFFGRSSWQSSYEREFKIPFSGEIEPGIYDLRTVSFSGGDKLTFVANVAAFGSSFADSKFVFSVPPGKLIYLGTIDIEVLNSSYESAHEQTIIGKRTTTYNIQVKNELKKALDEFKIKYPHLYERFKDNVMSAPWVK